MKGLLAFFLLLYLNDTVYSQTDSLVFIDYDTVIHDLKKNGKESVFYQNLDYQALLDLDENCYKLLDSINPGFANNLGWLDPIPDSLYSKHYFVKATDLKKFFLNKDEFNSIIDKIWSHYGINCSKKLYKTIYIKSNEKAYFALKGDCAGYYLAKYRKGEIIIDSFVEIVTIKEPKTEGE
jgi:hypothetical protein